MKEVKFRCSSLGYLMTEPKLKIDKDVGNLSETAKTHIEDVWIRINYNRKSFVSSKYLEKGLAIEDNSIALVSACRNSLYQKNMINFENDYITGTPDIVDGDLVIDTKSSWSLFTFFRSENTTLYEWQLRGYMMLTGASKAILAYCLIDTPEHVLQSEISKACWPLINAQKYTTDEEILTRLESEKEKVISQLYLNHSFNDIPLEKKYKPFEITRDLDKEKQLISKIEKAREYYNTLTL